MRPGQHNKRGRNRHRSGGGGSNGGGNPLSRVYESNGPDVKVRGTAQTVAEKYLQLGRDAQSSGDNVMAESYYQHAEHYLRIVAAAQAYQQQMQQQYRRPGEDYDDEDTGDEQPEAASVESRGGAMQGADAAEGMGEQPEEGERPAQQQSPQQGQGYRQQREFRDRDQGRDYRERDNRERDNRDREPRDQNGPRDQLPPQFGGGRERNRSRWQDRRDQQQTAYEQRPGSRAEEAPQPRVEAEVASSGQWEAPSFLRRPAPLPAAEPQPAAPVEAAAAPAPAPAAQAAAPERKPRGRPRREKPAEAPEASGSAEPAKEQAD